MMKLLALALSLLLGQGPIITGHRTVSGGHGSEGPFTASTASGTWTNVANAKVCDSVFATRFITAGNTSPALTLTGFGFSVPGSATIQGIAAAITHEDFVQTGGLQDSNVQLVKAGSPNGNNEASGSGWNNNGSPETFNYGGTNDLWGTAWTPANVNAANFGITITVQNTNAAGPATAAVDCATITVYW